MKRVTHSQRGNVNTAQVKANKKKKPIFECHICHKAYAASWNLTRHWRVAHSKSELEASSSSYKNRCPDCEATFPTKRLLLEHRRVNHGLETVECPDCSNLYSSKANLMRHHNKHHRGDLGSAEKSSVEEATLPTPPPSSSQARNPQESQVEGLLSRLQQSVEGWRQESATRDSERESYFLHLGRYDPSST